MRTPTTAPKSLDDYVTPDRLEEGDVVRIIRVEEPRKPGGDKSSSLGGGRRVFYSGGSTPQEGGFAVISRETSSGRFYNATVISREDAARRLGIRETPATPTISQAYLKEVGVQAAQLETFAEMISQSLQALKTTEVPESELKPMLDKATAAYKTEREKIKGALAYSLDAAAEDSTEQKRYRRAHGHVLALEKTFGEALHGLEAKAKAYDQQQAQKGYDVKLPDKKEDGPKKETLYGIEVIVGRRTLKIVFPENSLPADEDSFLEYLGNESNFPDRQDREIAHAYLERVTGGATALYDGKRLRKGEPFTAAFGDKTITKVTTEGGQEVQREFKKSQARSSQGGPLGAMLYR